MRKTRGKLGSLRVKGRYNFTCMDKVQKENYERELQGYYEKSQELFEKQLSYLSAGALSLSIGFSDDVVDPEHAIFKWLLFIFWILLGLTLMLNFVSHIISAKRISSAIDSIRAGSSDTNKIAQSYKVLNWINLTTVVMLCAGVSAAITYFSINLYHK